MRDTANKSSFIVLIFPLISKQKNFKFHHYGCFNILIQNFNLKENVKLEMSQTNLVRGGNGLLIAKLFYYKGLNVMVSGRKSHLIFLGHLRESPDQFLTFFMGRRYSMYVFIRSSQFLSNQDVTQLQTTERLTLLTVSPLLVDQFGRSIRFFPLEFVKEAIFCV